MRPFMRGGQERRLTVLRITVAAFAHSIAALSMATSATGGSSRDRAVGTVERLTLLGFPNTVHVNATSGPNGEGAHGMFCRRSSTRIWVK